MNKGKLIGNLAIWIAVAFIVAIVIAFFVFGVKWVKRLFGFDDDDGDKQNNIDDIWTPSPYYPDGGVVTADFDVDFYVTRLSEVLNDWMQLWYKDRCRVLKEVNNLNDNQLIALTNRYRTVVGKTLARELQELWDDGCVNLLEAPARKLSKRLDKLNIQ